MNLVVGQRLRLSHHPMLVSKIDPQEVTVQKVLDPRGRVASIDEERVLKLLPAGDDGKRELLITFLKYPTPYAVTPLGYCSARLLPDDTAAQDALILQHHTGDETLDKRPVVNAEDAILTMMQLTWAVASLHEAGLAHLDLKPSNLVQPPSSRADSRLVRILDFGSARLADKELAQSVGADYFLAPYSITPAYAAPEEPLRPMDGVPKYDLLRVDVWKLCMMGAHLLYPDCTPYEAVVELRRKSIVSPFESILLRGLQDEPRMRPADAKALALEFCAFGYGKRVMVGWLHPSDSHRQSIGTANYLLRFAAEGAKVAQDLLALFLYFAVYKWRGPHAQPAHPSDLAIPAAIVTTLAVAAHRSGCELWSAAADVAIELIHKLQSTPLRQMDAERAQAPALISSTEQALIARRMSALPEYLLHSLGCDRPADEVFDVAASTIVLASMSWSFGGPATSDLPRVLGAWRAVLHGNAFYEDLLPGVGALCGLSGNVDAPQHFASAEKAAPEYRAIGRALDSTLLRCPLLCALFLGRRPWRAIAGAIEILMQHAGPERIGRLLMTWCVFGALASEGLSGARVRQLVCRMASEHLVHGPPALAETLQLWNAGHIDAIRCAERLMLILFDGADGVVSLWTKEVKLVHTMFENAQ